MKIPLSWVKDYVDIELPIEELARRLTLAGLEVEELTFVGLPLPPNRQEAVRQGLPLPETKVGGLEWDRQKIVVGSVLEVNPHPEADRLVLCRLDDGTQEHVVLTGAPNLFPHKGLGPLEKPLKVAYAREGAQLYDGHKPGQELFTLKRARIRGVESYSMACSEKELGISEEHEGVIILDDDAPVGMPLADYMGDVVLTIAIIPNIARAANIVGVAREIAAITNRKLRLPDWQYNGSGPGITGRAKIEIRQPELNPRFVLGLVEGVEVKPSPYWVQRRLRLAGMRPINNIVDATNYVMLEVGEPLHAFDMDILEARAGGRPPTIITRLAEPGERLKTLDGIERQLDDFTILVADTAGALSIGGVMGGFESEVYAGTRRVLLEGAAWNFINIRRTVGAQKLDSEAAYRFARGVHPAMAERGVRRGLAMIETLAGGATAAGLVDAYPLPADDPLVSLGPPEVRRWLGIDLSPAEIAHLLERLEFVVSIDGDQVHARTPDHRLDIGQGIIGQADLMEEIARIHGYDRIPETLLADPLPPQYGSADLDAEEALRDLLVGLGLQEVVTYRMTSPEREARLLKPGSPPNDRPYLTLANPISPDRQVLRQNLLGSVLEMVERNARINERLAIFEIGPVFHLQPDQVLPEEPLLLAIALSGPRTGQSWQSSDRSPMDFFDLKGILEEICAHLGIEVIYKPIEHPTYHPGKCAQMLVSNQAVGVMGELHPQVRLRYSRSDQPLLAAEVELDKLLGLPRQQAAFQPIAAFPPVLEDLALIVDEQLAEEQVRAEIIRAGGALVSEVRLFDLFKGEQIGTGKKSLAYAVVYQAPDRTLTDETVARQRARIVKALENKFGAQLRSS